jgi:molybdate transport system ATP-binding protein
MEISSNAASAPLAASPGTAANGLSASLRKRWLNDGRQFELEVTLDVPSGITILFGASGSGKTTLLDCLAGLVEPDAGRIFIGNTTFLDSERGYSLPASRRRIGYVFQDLALFPHLTTEANVAYGLQGVPTIERAARTASMLESLRIAPLRQRRPREISGGERQRVALARALVTDPSLLLLDEPLVALDAHIKARILEDLRAWNAAHQIPILYVTHSREEVFALGERVLVLEEGKVTAQGTPYEVMQSPRRETIAQLAGFENIYDATVVSTHEARGTMTCRLAASQVELETPLVRAAEGSVLRVGIRAGDILLATLPPMGLSARNVIRGRIISLEQRDVMMIATVDCGVEFEVHLTLAARDSLTLAPGGQVWLVVKTYSCHLMNHPARG